MTDRTKKISVIMAPGLDHHPSDRVDVIPNKDGEFVQVWNAPYGHPNRQLILSYQRTPNGTVRIESRVYLQEGPWAMIDTCDNHRTFYYRGRHDDMPRHELILPSGRILIHDFRAGLVTHRIFTTSFDWEKLKPVGRQLGDRAIIKINKDGAQIFVSTYQQRWENEQLLSNELVVVETYQGAQLVSIHEPTRNDGA